MNNFHEERWKHIFSAYSGYLRLNPMRPAVFGKKNKTTESGQQCGDIISVKTLHIFPAIPPGEGGRLQMTGALTKLDHDLFTYILFSNTSLKFACTVFYGHLFADLVLRWAVYGHHGLLFFSMVSSRAIYGPRDKELHCSTLPVFRSWVFLSQTRKKLP